MPTYEYAKGKGTQSIQLVTNQVYRNCFVWSPKLLTNDKKTTVDAQVNLTITTTGNVEGTRFELFRVEGDYRKLVGDFLLRNQEATPQIEGPLSSIEVSATRQGGANIEYVTFTAIARIEGMP